MKAPAPSELRYQKTSRELVIAYRDEHGGEYGNERFVLSAEFLRVHSPSAEVQGHNNVGGVLPRHKEEVAITAIEQTGNYAVKIRFSDGHDTGLYSWDWLYKLCHEQAALWQEYEQKLAAEPDPASGIKLVRFIP
jgi:DUF971 family protein